MDEEEVAEILTVLAKGRGRGVVRVKTSHYKRLYLSFL